MIDYYLRVDGIEANGRIRVAMLQPGEPEPALLRITRGEALDFMEELIAAVKDEPDQVIERADNGIITRITYTGRDYGNNRGAA